MLNTRWFIPLIMIFMLGLPTWAVEDNLTIVGGDEASMREFMEVYMRDMGPHDTETIIYVGQLPDELPVDVQLPDGRIIGAMERRGQYASMELILVSNEAVDVLDGFFQTQLEADGWERIGINYGQRGFVVQESTFGDYCNADKEYFINVHIREFDGESQVRFGINLADPYMCNQGDMSEMQNNDPYLRLPKLIAPDGVTMLMNRGGGGGGGGYPGNMYSATSTWLTSEVLTLDELMVAYDAQLVENGWEMISTESGEHTSLSLWTFGEEDGRWSGYFSLMESAIKDGQYYATIMVEQIGE